MASATRQRFTAALSLGRSNGTNHSPGLLRRSAFDFAVFGEQFNDVIHHAPPLIDVRVLATTKQHGDLNFVVVFEEPNRLFDFETDIVIAGLGAETNFFQFGLVLFTFGLAFGFVVFEFTEVHDAANRRLCITGDFNEVQPGLAGFVQSLLSRNDAQLGAVGVNDSNGGNSDLLVDSIRFVDG